MLTVIIASQGVLLMCFILLISQITDLRNKVAEVLEYHEYEEFSDFSDAPEAVSEEEEYVSERLRAFDARINKMKNELSDTPIPERPRGAVADILHPGVENLPHDSIIDYQTKPPVIEYAD